MRVSAIKNAGIEEEKSMNFHWLIALLAFSAPAAFAQAPTIQHEVERLLHHPGAVMNAIDLDQMGLSHAKTPVEPWTSSYWPDSIGGIAVRYGRKTVLGQKIETALNYGWNRDQWKAKDYRMKKNVLSLSEDEIARQLAPSEKYDLLMGDMNFSLTNNIIADIDYRYHYKLSPQGSWYPKNGMVSWVGICDGWTVASLHTPRPVRTIRVRGATGQMITFYPDDLKALASHLFARAGSWLGIERVGNRCQARKSGRGEGCDDIDAGLWHAAVMNRIGIDHRGFVIDVDNNFKVNNHPVFGYDVQYFNPVSGMTGTILKSTVPVDQVRPAGPAGFSPDTAMIVGVRMSLTMLDYAWPTGEEVDSPKFDKLRTASYVYLLEMDSQGQILGGQWQGKAESQPDMIWMIAPNQLAWSSTSTEADDGMVLDPKNPEIWGNVDWRFKGDGRIPVDWFNASLKATRFAWPAAAPFSPIVSAHPLAEMVYYLMDRARE